MTDPSGTVAATYQYDPYGNVVGGSSSIYNPFQYASGWISGVTGFTHFGQRWYAPATTFTRWTQQDPTAGSLGSPTSQCRYAYANDDPVNLTDPSGSYSRLGCALAGASFAADAFAFLAAIGIVSAPFAVIALLALAGGALAAASFTVALHENSSLGSVGLNTLFLGGSLNISALSFALPPLAGVNALIDLVSVGLSC